MKSCKHTYFLLVAGLIFISTILQAQPQRSYTSSEIQLLLKKLNTAGTVLYIAAHPDDENTRLLSYLANERCVRTSYVSLTRGDGGQNLIGQDIGPLLGLIRSYELMAARNTDGASQLFTRAYDFGYSKSAEETFNIWGQEEVLDDLVYLIRFLKPDLIITRFAPDGSGGHGHHTASAILAEDAYKAASDPKSFPKHFSNHGPWKAHSLLYNNAGRFRNPNADMSGNVELNVGGYNPYLGRSYGELAGLSRSMHKSQGFGSRNFKGEIMEYFKPIMGFEPREDIFEGLDISLNRIKGSRELAVAVAMANDQFNPSRPSDIVPHLLTAYKALDKIQDDHWKQIKKAELEELIAACMGLWVEVNAAQPTITPGQSLPVQYYVINRSSLPVSIQRVSLQNNHKKLSTSLSFNRPVEINDTIQIPKDQPVTGPYWLKHEPVNGLFQLEHQSQLEKPVDDGHFQADFTLDIDGTVVNFSRPLLYRWVDPVQGEQFRMLEIAPEVSLHWTDKVLVFSGDEGKKAKVTVKAGRDQVKGEVRLKAASDYRIIPEKYDFHLNNKDEEQVFEFELFPGKDKGLSEIYAEATVDGKNLNRSKIQIKYDHIPIQVVFPVASLKAANLDIEFKADRLGYIPGAGDEVASGLRQIGYRVDELSEEGIDKNDLQQYKAILTGVRAFNTNERLFAQMNRLNNYVEKGGVLIVQYVTSSWVGPLKGPISPYDLNVSRLRVTDENAPVTFLLPNHPVLNLPNKITQHDFEGWVQERGLYYADKWSEEFQAPLEMSDPGESGLSGGLLIAPYGKGYYVYTGLSFFRQIPNGTPGAFRLLTNLIELGSVQP